MARTVSMGAAEFPFEVDSDFVAGDFERGFCDLLGMLLKMLLEELIAC